MIRIILMTVAILIIWAFLMWLIYSTMHEGSPRKFLAAITSAFFGGMMRSAFNYFKEEWASYKAKKKATNN